MEPINDNTSTVAAKTAKMVNGSGSLLPVRSSQYRNASNLPFGLLLGFCSTGDTKTPPKNFINSTLTPPCRKHSAGQHKARGEIYFPFRNATALAANTAAVLCRMDSSMLNCGLCNGFTIPCSVFKVPTVKYEPGTCCWK